MAKSKKRKLPFDKRNGVIAIPRHVLESPVYKQLSSQAKALMIQLQIHWRPERPIGFGIREAQQTIPCSRHKAVSVFKELQEAGFIVMVDESLFCSRTESKTRTWRLTWMPWNSRFPTNEWERRSST